MAIRTELVYGKSGSGKTTWWAKIAEHIFVTTGKRTRLYIADGGLETVEAKGLIPDVVEVCQFNLWPHPFETCQFICEGWWPRDPQDPTSSFEKVSLDKLSSFGMFVFEGLSVMADYLMGDTKGGLADRMADGESLNNDESFRFQDGSIKVGGNARTHYMTAQRRIEHYIKVSKGLPGWVQWTAHERAAQDDITKLTEVGPDIAGKALTTKIGASFGNTIHLHPIARTTKKTDKLTQRAVETVEIFYRAYTRRHYDPAGGTTIPFYANNRMPDDFASEMPEFLEPPDPLKFYQILAAAKKKSREKRDQLTTVKA